MKQAKRGIILLSSIFVFYLSLNGQSGPAGIGNSDGSKGPRNIIWIDAQKLNYYNGADVTRWPDISGNAHDLLGSGTNPTFYTSVVNGKNIVRFSPPANDHLVFNSDFYTSEDGIVNTNYTFYWVGARRSIATSDNYIFGGNLTSTNRNLYSGWRSGRLCANQYGNNCETTSYVTNEVGEFGIIASTLNSSGRRLYENGNLVASITSATKISTASGNLQYLGRRNDNFANADIAEVFFYQTDLTSTQRIIIENYLSAKYNIPISNDYFSGIGGYTNEVVGIGTIDGSDVYSSTTGSGGGLYLSDVTSPSLNQANEFLFAGHNGLAHNITISDVSNGARWTRIWRIEKSTASNVNALIKFDPKEAGYLAPEDINDYKLLYRSSTSGNFTEVFVTSASIVNNQVVFEVNNQELVDGYYTLGVPAHKTWYSLVSGNWDDPSSWTLDPSGFLELNPANETPTTSSTAAFDRVIINSGKTIIIDTNNKINSSLTVEGILDLTTTTNHEFSEIKGSGRIRCASDNFPSGNATHFITKDQGEGTVEYYGSDYVLNTPRIFYNMEIQLDNSSNQIVLLKNYSLNGGLFVNQGVLTINDNTNTNVINLSVTGDVTIANNAKINVGSGDSYTTNSAYHKFVIKGDFINNGIALFTNRSAPDYINSDITGAVEVIFNNNINNQSIFCNGPTVFNQLTCEKGIDATYILDISASRVENFSLYGRNNERVLLIDGVNRDGNKALRLLSGTIKLSNNINLPNLTNYYSYDIDRDACLWISENASIATGTGDYLTVYGTLKISDNCIFTDQTYQGIMLREQGLVKIEGGTIYFNVFSTSQYLRHTGEHVGSYIQTGGTVYILHERGEDYASFHLPYQTNVFKMSGGILHIKDKGNGNGAGRDFALIINSKLGNYEVTGGTVIIERTNDRNYKINSRAPFWNLILRNSYSTSGNILIDQYIENPLLEPDDSQDDCEDMPFLPLVVLNNFTIEGSNNLTFITNNTDVSVGADFILENGAVYSHGTNTTSFIGNKDSYIYSNNNAVPAPLTFNNLVIAKSQQSTPDTYWKTEIANTGRTSDPYESNNVAIEVKGNLTITKGEFNTYQYTTRLIGNLEIVDGKISANETIPGSIHFQGTNLQTIKGAIGKEQEFGSLVLNNSLGAKLLSDINATNFTLSQGIVNLDIYNLSISGNIIGSDFSSSKMFQTAGKASDGGISFNLKLSNRNYNNETVILFPLGSLSTYNPAVVYINGNPGINSGIITIKGVDGIHPATTSGNGIPYYWTVNASGFSGVDNNTVNYLFTKSNGWDENDVNCLKLLGSGSDWVDSGPSDEPNLDFKNVGFASGDFTGGNKLLFNKPTIYYSRVFNGIWSDANSWSVVAYGGEVSDKTPEPYDIVKIGYSGTPGSYLPHRIILDTGTPANPTQIANLIIEQNPEANNNEDLLSRLVVMPSSGLKVNGKISGNGEIQIQMDETSVPLLEGDMREFVATKGASIILESENANVIAPTNITFFPKLSVRGNSSYFDDSKSITFATDIQCYSLHVDFGGTLILNNGAFGDILVQDSLRIGGYGNDSNGRIIFQNNGNTRTINVGKNLIFDTDGNRDKNQLFIVNGGSDNLTHTLNIKGDIILRNDSSFLDLFSSNNGLESNIKLNLLGETNNQFISSSLIVPELYRISINRSSGTTFTFFDPFTLNGPADGQKKSLELISGNCHLNDPLIMLDLSSGNDDFTIPQNVELCLTGSTVIVTGDDTGIRLDGTLRIGNGAIARIDRGTNNYIEYSSNSTIWIEEGSLYVGSQIRRPLNVNQGALKFTQNKRNSIVMIGTDGTAPEDNRAIFEIFGAGSEFNQNEENSNITIACRQANPKIAALYLDPATKNIAPNCRFTIGSTYSASDLEYGIYSTILLEDLVLASNRRPTLKTSVVPLQLNGDLIINTGTAFDANGLDLKIAGNFINNGTFRPSNNTTIFNGSTNQTISGNTIFHNLEYESSHQLNITSNLTINNRLSVAASDAIINTNNSTIILKGNLYHQGTQIYSGLGDGIKMQGEKIQEITGNGKYAKLSINNGWGVNIKTGSNILINNALKLEKGILQIESNLLTLGINCLIEEASPFSISNMIQTNLSFTDNGVKKIFPQNADRFVFPIGSANKYTPVAIEFENNTTGSLIVKAANERHPAIADDDELSCDFNDINNVLQFNWEVTSAGFTNASGNLSFQYSSEDVKLDNTCGLTVFDYITAKLMKDGLGNWNKFNDKNTFDEASNQLIFTFIAASDNELSADYTAGLEEAIPDKVPKYTTNRNGEWTDGTIWTPNIPGGPRGAIAVVEHDVSVSNDRDIFSYMTEINGTLRINKTKYHRLGNVYGTGTLYTQLGDLPAGFYNDFIYKTGGTFEFGSVSSGDDYSVLSGLQSVHNLVFSGTGLRNLPNFDLSILGDLVINGTDNDLMMVNTFDRRIRIHGNIVFNNGSFDAGTTDNAIIEIGGSSAQTISGSNTFTGTNAFHHFIMNNVFGLSLSSSIQIDQTLTFIDGIIKTNGTSSLTLNSSLNDNDCKDFSGIVKGAGINKFVDGILNKYIQNNGVFDFPVGNNNRFANISVSSVSEPSTQIWQANYHNQNPALADPSMPSTTIRTGSNLNFVSNREYWQLKTLTGSASALISLYYDNQSAITPNSEMKIAEWFHLPEDAWDELPSNSPSNNMIGASISTSFNKFGNGNFFTLATLNAPRVLTWTGNFSTSWNLPSNWSGSALPTAIDNVIIPQIISPKFNPAIDIAAECGSLSIESGGILTITPGNSLTVNGSTQNNGSLRLLSPLNNGISGSFIDNGILPGSGNYQVQRYIIDHEFHYVSTPIHGGNAYSNLFTSFGSSFNPNLYTYNERLDLNSNPLTAPDGVYNSDNLVSGWEFVQPRSTDTPVELNVTSGYAFYTDINGIITFSGTNINTGDQLFTNLTFTENDPIYEPMSGYYDGWNLVGNPYPSCIDWDIIRGGLVNIDDAIYVWDGSQYATYVAGISGGAGSQNNFIAPMQAFFIHANADNPILSLKNIHRVHNPTTKFKSDIIPSMPNNQISLKLMANGKSDLMAIYFKTNATTEFDGVGDAFRLFSWDNNSENEKNNEVPHIFSITPLHKMALSINSQPEELLQNIVIPIGIRIGKNGQYTITKEMFNFQNIIVYLVDKLENKMICLNNENSYTFNFVAGDDRQRFELRFIENTTPFVNELITKKVLFEKSQFNYHITDNTFIDTDYGDSIVSLQASMIDGSSLPSWLSFNPLSKSFTGTPQNIDVGTVSIKISATDRYGATGESVFEIEILNINDGPILTGNIPNIELYENEDFDYLLDQNLFIDIDKDDKLTLSACLADGNPLPQWMTFDNADNKFYGNGALPGIYDIKVTATDIAGASASTNFKITVKNATKIEDSKISKILLSPNPTNGKFCIKIESDLHYYNVSIKDNLGREILSRQIKDLITEFDISKYNSGVYFIELSNQKELKVIKIILDNNVY